MKITVSPRKTFPFIWVWIIFLIILGIGHVLYEKIVPCSPGLVVIDCVFSKAYLTISWVEAAVVYLFIAGIYTYIQKYRNQNSKMWVYVFIGIISSLWVFMPMLTSNYILNLLSFPVLYANVYFMMGPGVEVLSRFIY